MPKVHTLVLSALVVQALAIGSGVARAEDIQGVVVRTLVITETSRLVGDVTAGWRARRASRSARRTSR